MFKRVQIYLTIACLVLALTACSAKPSSIRYDVFQGAESLDPQFALGETEQLVIYNIFEGLMWQLPSGELEKGAAESYEISADGKTYTFKLKNNMVWDDEDKTPVTANDFVFAFRRIFNQISPSPFSGMYAAIQNTDKVLSGELPEESLGVKAIDNLTLQFTLDYADPMFLENLSHSAAMPCSQKLFESKKGKYGASVKDTPCNGPFTLINWDNESKIYMQSNQLYYEVESMQVPSVYLMIARDQQTAAQKKQGEIPPTRFELVMDGKSDGCRADYFQANKALKQGLSYETIDDTVWALVFNQNHPVFANEKVRESFMQSINRQTLEGFLRENKQENLHSTDRLIPPAITMFTKSYVQQSTVETINKFNTETAKQIFRDGMTELKRETLTEINLLVPKESNFLGLSGVFQQAWQQNLAVSVNIEEIPKDEISTRLGLGDYHMALVPLKATSNSPGSILEKFTSDSVANITGFNDPSLDEALKIAAQAKDQQEILDSYSNAESILLNTATALPLMVETNYFILGEGVSGIQFFPYNGKVYFKNAVALR